MFGDPGESGGWFRREFRGPDSIDETPWPGSTVPTAHIERQSAPHKVENAEGAECSEDAEE
jgi:hypothetical protein